MPCSGACALHRLRPIVFFAIQIAKFLLYTALPEQGRPAVAKMSFVAMSVDVKGKMPASSLSTVL
mgnify:CR=1 FL=1